jgi:hypothetical protein
MEVCFGTPVLNPWHQFTLDAPAQNGGFEIVLPDEEPDPIVWKTLPPGSWIE